VGGRDWRPYHPDETLEIGLQFQSHFAKEKFYIYPEQPTTDANSILTEAEAKRQLLVVMVDAWSTQLPKYRSLLTAYDGRSSNNTGVVVPWNPKDAETQDNLAELEEALIAAFPVKAQGTSDQFLRITGPPEDLTNALLKLLAALRGRVLKSLDSQRPALPNPVRAATLNVPVPGAG
jgi:FxsC-like protein